MPISIVHYRIEISIFNSKSFMRVAKSIFSVNVKTTLAKYLFMLLCGIILLLLRRDVELNPVSKKTRPLTFPYFIIIIISLFIVDRIVKYW